MGIHYCNKDHQLGEKAYASRKTLPKEANTSRHAALVKSESSSPAAYPGARRAVEMSLLPVI